MVKKHMIAVLAVSVLCLLVSCLAPAQEKLEDLKAKLKETRVKKVQLLIDYDEALCVLTKEKEDKLARLGADYRKKRDECMNEMNEKISKTRKDYDGRIRAVSKEENDLIKVVGPGEASNFAKTRLER